MKLYACACRTVPVEPLHGLRQIVDAAVTQVVPDKGVPFVKAFGGFSDGTCAAAGFPTKEGTAPGTGEKDKERSYDIYGK